MHKLSLDYIKSKWAHAGFQKYFRNTGWMFAGQMTMIVSLFVNIWIARHLGPTNFGNFSYIIAFASIFSFLPSLGIQDILIRDLVRYPEERNKIIGTCMRLFMLGGIVTFILASSASLIVNGFTLVSLLVILYATSFLWTPVTVIPSYFQSVVESKRNALIQMIGAVGISLIKIFFILSGKGIIWLIFAYALDYCVSGLLYIYTYRRIKGDFVHWIFDSEIAKRVLKASYPLMLASGATYLLLKFNHVLVKFFLDETALGLYSVAVKLGEIWYFIPVIISASLFPAIINAKIASEEKYRGRLKKLSLFLFLIAFIISIGVTLLAPTLVPLLFGYAYVEAIPLAQIYIWSGIGYFLTIVTTKYLMTENHLHSIWIYSALSALISIGLNLALISGMGLAGAAIASVISYAVFPTLVLLNKDA